LISHAPAPSDKFQYKNVIIYEILKSECMVLIWLLAALNSLSHTLLRRAIVFSLARSFSTLTLGAVFNNVNHLPSYGAHPIDFAGKQISTVAHGNNVRREIIY
jgi:hypothetical protein